MIEQTNAPRQMPPLPTLPPPPAPTARYGEMVACCFSPDLIVGPVHRLEPGAGDD